MKRILYIAYDDMGKRKGGGLAMKAYYNALCRLFPEAVDAIMPEEYCVGQYAGLIGAPRRSFCQAISSGSLHRYKKFVRKYLDSHQGMYDVCVINGGLYAGDMMDMIHDAGLKIMVIHHNFEREYHIDNKDLWTLKGHYAGFVIHNERNAYRKADVNCFLTIDDVALFCDAYGQHAKNMLLGVFEPDDIPLPNIGDVEHRKILGITGSMNSVQTQEGIMDFKEHYLPIFEQELPEWKIVIAGRNPSEKIRQFADENSQRIELIPNPENMAEVINRCSLFLCPTNVGGGLKLRVMDGLRQGLPVLAHKVSARGYDAFTETPYFADYENKTGFRDGVRKLAALENSMQQRTEIQKLYEHYFGFSQGVERMRLCMDALNE